MRTPLWNHCWTLLARAFLAVWAAASCLALEESVAPEVGGSDSSSSADTSGFTGAAGGFGVVFSETCSPSSSPPGPRRATATPTANSNTAVTASPITSFVVLSLLRGMCSSPPAARLRGGVRRRGGGPDLAALPRRHLRRGRSDGGACRSCPCLQTELPSGVPLRVGLAANGRVAGHLTVLGHPDQLLPGVGALFRVIEPAKPNCVICIHRTSSSSHLFVTAGHHYRITCPPSTLQVCPVMFPAFGGRQENGQRPPRPLGSASAPEAWCGESSPPSIARSPGGWQAAAGRATPATPIG